MEEVYKNKLLRTVLLIVGGYFLFAGLIHASGFLIPLSFAALLSMLMLPIVNRIERWGLGRGWSALVAILLLLGLLTGIFFLISEQISSMADDWPQMKDKIVPKINDVKQYFEKKTGIIISDPLETLKNNSTQLFTSAQKYFSRVMSATGNLLLVMVYLFFMLLYRSKFKKLLLDLSPAHKEDDMQDVITRSAEVAQSYLLGKTILIIILGVLYGVGFLIIGLKYAVLVALIAAILTIIPYIGNIIAGILTLGMVSLTGGGMTDVLGVLGVFAITQFVESYILQPYIVGHEVNLNPLVTIVVVVAGGFVWGIPGMMIAIPLLGIVKVIADNAEDMQPYGRFLGESESGHEEYGKKVKRWFSNIWKDSD